MNIVNEIFIAAAGCSFLAISSVLSAEPSSTTTVLPPSKSGKISASSKISAVKQSIVKTPSVVAQPTNASDNALSSPMVNASTNSTLTTTTTATSSALSTSQAPITLPPASSTVASLSPDDHLTDSTSPVLILFCTVLLFVAAALVVKVVIHGKKSRRHFGLDSFRLPTNRSSSQGARLSLGGGPALGIPTSAAGINLGGTSAMYTAMPGGDASLDAPPVAASTTLRDPRLDWERQFFDDDDEEHLATNMEVEPQYSSRLQFNVNQ